MEDTIKCNSPLVKDSFFRKADQADNPIDLLLSLTCTPENSLQRVNVSFSKYSLKFFDKYISKMVELDIEENDINRLVSEMGMKKQNRLRHIFSQEIPNSQITLFHYETNVVSFVGVICYTVDEWYSVLFSIGSTAFSLTSFMDKFDSINSITVTDVIIETPIID